MTNKFYIAGSFTNKEKVNNIIMYLEQREMINTFNWTRNEKAVSEKMLKNIGLEELNAVKQSNILIAFFQAVKEHI